ncbi:MAG TPA: hypothetical protein VML55_26425 [Planctomycetaceae bacterium]|nr:hypothetical protein [Planctomycetaceae bacterium]
MPRHNDSDGSIDLTRTSLDELGRVPDCGSDSVDLEAETTPPPEPHTMRCGSAEQRELHQNPFPPEE